MIFVLEGTFYEMPEGPSGVSLILNNACFLLGKLCKPALCFLSSQVFVGSRTRCGSHPCAAQAVVLWQARWYRGFVSPVSLALVIYKTPGKEP